MLSIQLEFASKEISYAIYFDRRTLLDIKSCIRDAISSCDSNHLVKTVFGGKGAALLAAYEGICAEHHGGNVVFFAAKSDFKQCGICDQQSLRSAFASRLNIMTFKLLTKLKGRLHKSV